MTLHIQFFMLMPKKAYFEATSHSRMSFRTSQERFPICNQEYLEFLSMTLHLVNELGVKSLPMDMLD